MAVDRAQERKACFGDILDARIEASFVFSEKMRSVLGGVHLDQVLVLLETDAENGFQIVEDFEVEVVQTEEFEFDSLDKVETEGRFLGLAHVDFEDVDGPHVASGVDETLFDAEGHVLVQECVLGEFSHFWGEWRDIWQVDYKRGRY